MSGTSPVAAAPAAVPAPERAALRQAAQRFEAIFVRQLLAAARSAKLGEDVAGSAAADQFRSLLDETFAGIAAGQGMLGLGAAIERQLSARAEAPAR